LAKDSDNLAGSFATENDGGALSGLLAEEDALDRRMLWRLGSWGVGAVGAVTLAVFANQSQISWRHDQVAAADLTRQAQQIQSVAKDSQHETRRLASAIETLNTDRDRLYSRVSTLEQGLDSVTGAIAKQATTPASPAPSAASAKPAEAVAAAPAQAAAPSVAAVATTQATSPPAPEKPAAAEKPPAASTAEAAPAASSSVANAKPDNSKQDAAKADAAKPDSAKADSAKPETAKSESVKSDSTKPDSTKSDSIRSQPASPSAPLVASQSIMAPPDPAAAKLIEPGKPGSAVTATPIPELVASTAADDTEADETAPRAAIQRTEFGVDLGSANSVNGLRALWRGLLKSKTNAPLAALRPIIMVKEGTNGLGMQLRLVAGPLNDAGAAAKLCAAMTENRRACETTVFDGQRLQLTSDDPPHAAAKPVPRRRVYPKRAAATVVEEPKKPESSTIASWFGRKGQ
jgi:hypothetical protein